MDATAAAAAGPGWKVRAAIFAAALWWGSLCMTGFVVVPMLFANLPTPAIAGAMAGKLFGALSWVATGCGLVVLLASQSDDGGSSLDWRGGVVPFAIAGMLLALLVEFGVAPRILARDHLQLWHGVGSAMYGLQWLCAGVVLWKVSGPAAPSSRA